MCRISNVINFQMKKTVLVAALALGAMTASAQGIEQSSFFDNWSLGLDGGVTTPMNHAAFWGDMRGVAGLHLDKQITPVFGLGVEATAAVNTSSWRNYVHSTTAFDQSYVGAYATVDLFNLFGGYDCATRPFSIAAVLGAGWGHDYINGSNEFDYRKDKNYFVTKAGLNFNFNVNDNLTVSLKPYVAWNMNGAPIAQTASGYNINAATFNFLAGVTYHFGDGFECVYPGYSQNDIDALNSQVNAMRGERDAALAAVAAAEAQNAALAADLAACRNKAPEVIKEVSNNLNSVRYVFFKIGSSAITADQQPNVEMIAAYMKNHPNSKVVIKGYASKDGPLELNIALAKKRAEAVKNALVSKYKISASRIEAEGQGIGEMFEEESWNRVSICTLEEAK